jgi:hypothetical protein
MAPRSLTPGKLSEPRRLVDGARRLKTRGDSLAVGEAGRVVAGEDAPAKPSAPRRKLQDGDLDAVDGVRGLASLFVVVGHILTLWIAGESKSAYPEFGLEVRAAPCGRLRTTTASP